MNPRARRLSLVAIAIVAVAASANALAHSYAGLYSWALQHRVSGWQARTWPAEIDVFLVIGELALYMAYLDRWPLRQRVWPWATAVTGRVVSMAGNVGHVQAVADQLTAAASPVAAFVGLMIGLLVLKMSRERTAAVSASLTQAESGQLRVLPGHLDPEKFADPIVSDAVLIVRSALTSGEQVSQRIIAARLRAQGHRFSNAQLRDIVTAATVAADQRVA